jgi:hypothetical protein
MYNDEDVFDLLNYHDQELTSDHISEWKESTLEAEGLGLAEAGIMMLEKNDLNEQQVATTGQGNISMIPCYNEILKKKSYVARLQCMNSR